MGLSENRVPLNLIVYHTAHLRLQKPCSITPSNHMFGQYSAIVPNGPIKVLKLEHHKTDWLNYKPSYMHNIFFYICIYKTDIFYQKKVMDYDGLYRYINHCLRKCEAFQQVFFPQPQLDHLPTLGADRPGASGGPRAPRPSATRATGKGSVMYEHVWVILTGGIIYVTMYIYIYVIWN